MEGAEERTSALTAWTRVGGEPKVIAPGLVLIKQALDPEQQLHLANYALHAGSDPEHGFWATLPETGEKVLNSDTGRGRIYDVIESFQEPQNVRTLCEALVSTARSLDKRMPEMNPTHLLLLYYATSQGMYWHRDSDKNDGDNDHPIVSISIGNSCDFGYKLVARQEEFLRLDSGDVLIWGGPNRMLLHSVGEVHAGSCPEFLRERLGDVRLNFTYRDAPNVLGKEHLFKYDVDSTYIQLLPHLIATTPVNKDDVQNLSASSSSSVSFA
ncbi:hypothetical protein QOT17_014365 [Balamuthia mandrillaris]